MCEAWDIAKVENRPENEFGRSWNLRTDKIKSEHYPEMWWIGKGAAPLNYCPWCGAKLPDDQHE